MCELLQDSGLPSGFISGQQNPYISPKTKQNKKLESVSHRYNLCACNMATLSGTHTHIQIYIRMYMKNFCPGPKNFFFEAHKVDTQDAITRERDSNGEEKRSEREREHFPSCHKKQLSQKERYCHPLNPSWQCLKRRSAAFICTLSPSLSLLSKIKDIP